MSQDRPPTWYPPQVSYPGAVAPPRPQSARPVGAKTVLKIVGLVFGALFTTCIAYSVLNRDAIRAHSAERERVKDEGLATLEARVRTILQQTAALDLREEQACPEETRSATIDPVPTSLEQLARFAPDLGSTAPAVTAGYFVSNDIGALTPAQREGESKFRVADKVEEVLAKKHLGIYVPERGRAPKVIDRNAFEGGYFVGSIVIVDWQAAKVLCHARFEATSSESLGGGVGISLGRGIVTIPLDDLQEDADEDYRRNFAAASALAVERVRLGAPTTK
jgi:hypothetical protein